MSRLIGFQRGFGKLEIVLLLTIAALVFQLFPSLGWGLWSALDIRTWSRTVWFALNALVLLALFAIRFGPELYADWKERRSRQRAAGSGQLGVGEPNTDPDYDARLLRDTDWRERAKKRLPWHQ